MHKGPKRKHASKIQAITSPKGFFVHVYGLFEGRQHAWTIFSRYGLDESLETVLKFGSTCYCTYGDSGYKWRAYLKFFFQGSSLTPNQAAFNKGMPSRRITTMWMFKEAKAYWSTVDFPRKMRAMQLPVGTIYICALLLCNITT